MTMRDKRLNRRVWEKKYEREDENVRRELQWATNEINGREKRQTAIFRNKWKKQNKTKLVSWL